MPTFTPATRACAATAVFLVALTSCSTAEEAAPSTPQDPGATSSTNDSAPALPSASATPEAESTKEEPSEEDPRGAGQLLAITIDADAVQPNAAEYDLDRGEQLLIDIDSDRPGELHVHSTPEQFIDFNAGTTQAELSIETPGSVEVEDHDTGAVVALIEVR